MLTPGMMRQLCPRLTVEQGVAWATELGAAGVEFYVSTPERMAHWLAQLCHESAGLTRLEEDLHYSAKRLAQVWPRRYAVDPRAADLQPNVLAHHLAHKPDVLANDVYAGRMGNGPPETGDGWRYHGRGPIQLTGRENYTRAGEALDLPLVEHPEMALQVDVGARVAAWYWATHGCNDLADQGDIGAITKAINGGSNGLQDRIAWHKRAMIVLGIA